MKLHFRFSRSASEDESSSVKDKEDLMAYSTGAMMSSAGYSKSSMTTVMVESCSTGPFELRSSSLFVHCMFHAFYRPWNC